MSGYFDVAPPHMQCSIAIQIGGREHAAAWKANSGAIEALRPIDIFDADEASHYLSKECSASYQPQAVALFESLVKTCDNVRSVLQLEQDRLVSALPAMPRPYVGTQQAKHYLALRPEMNEAAIRQLTSWTADDEKALNALSERLKTDDPSALAQKKRGTRQQVAHVIASLQLASAAFSTAQLDAIRQLRTAAFDKRKIATDAAVVKSAKLEGIGTPTWRALWEASRAYCETIFPASPFPVIDEKRCVLCHQELAADAQQQLSKPFRWQFCSRKSRPLKPRSQILWMLC